MSIVLRWRTPDPEQEYKRHISRPPNSSLFVKEDGHRPMPCSELSPTWPQSNPSPSRAWGSGEKILQTFPFPSSYTNFFSRMAAPSGIVNQYHHFGKHCDWHLLKLKIKLNSLKCFPYSPWEVPGEYTIMALQTWLSSQECKGCLQSSKKKEGSWGFNSTCRQFCG